jgi:hypothetical protein
MKIIIHVIRPARPQSLRRPLNPFAQPAFCCQVQARYSSDKWETSGSGRIVERTLYHGLVGQRE